ncbi:metallophosphoesterase family protein [Geobacter sulfurreducens]|uniref:metallophosphoesterase family protein n=1 Tax=Geobacter sulfurreducens TaxID=35554 RepID=UPI000DBB0664|nr:metallophosphoesterase family protein [Geobacter sulfurreducens]BBA71065.1 Serine/threonine-protein phosphatase 1 [Geobacter sulfurreducens]
MNHTIHSRRFVIPDIHGCALTLDRLLFGVLGLTRRDDLYLLGDYIDRGPRSREVMDLLISLSLKGYRVHTLRGNHEEMFLNSCRDRNAFRLWTLNGGLATLESFGVEDACEIPAHYHRFMEQMPCYLVLSDFVLVHASLDFSLPDPFANREAMLWSRSLEVRRERLGGRRVIGGHTPITRQEIERGLTTDRIVLDNGCIYPERPGMGSLTALELDTMTLHFQENIDQ